MSVTVLAIQPPVQLSAVTSRCRPSCSRAPSAVASASSVSSSGTSITSMVLAASGKLGGHLICAWADTLDVRRTHPPDAPVFHRQGGASGRVDVLPDGRFLRTVL